MVVIRTQESFFRGLLKCRIELLAVFALEIFGKWFAGIDLTSVQQLQCELL